MESFNASDVKLFSAKVNKWTLSRGVMLAEEGKCSNTLKQVQIGRQAGMTLKTYTFKAPSINIDRHGLNKQRELNTDTNEH